jgi:hypothetical protein
VLFNICCRVQVEEQYQREMGIAAQQQRTDAYMRSHTLSCQALLDPTSHLHPYPSDSVLVKPAGFGLGRSSPEAVAKVAKRHPGLQKELQSSLLLPSKFRWVSVATESLPLVLPQQMYMAVITPSWLVGKASGPFRG